MTDPNAPLPFPPQLAPEPHKSQWLVPNLIPRASINLLIGTAMTGRASLLLTQIDQYLASRQFLDYPLDSEQLPELPAILCMTRGLSWLYRKIQTLDLNALSYPQCFPKETWPSISGEQWYDTLSRVLDHLTVSSQGRQPRLLAIENIQMLMTSGKINDPHAVNEFMSQLNRFTSDRDCAILGTVGTAKMKVGDHYAHLQQRIMGSTHWADPCHTLIGLEVMDLHLPVSRRSTIREVVVMARNEPPRVLWADFDPKGRLCIVDKPDIGTQNRNEAELDSLLATRKPGEQLARALFLEWGEKLKISVRTVERWVASRLELGMLEKSGNGKATIYWRPTQQ